MRVSVLFVINCIILGETARFRFIPENDDFFKSCPGFKGYNDLFDTKDLKFEYTDDIIKIGGNATIVWEGIQPTDRIEANVEFFKLMRGEWQPTIYSTLFKNFCDVQYDQSALWYKVWTQHIPEEDRVCLNNIGATYHYRESVPDTILEFSVNIEGRYKVVFRFEAYDSENVMRENVICFEAHGELFKIK